MHTIEPYYNWRGFYTAEEDINSPFYGREYSEFEYRDSIYDHYIHPQWDNFGSTTLFIKILYTDYETGYCIMELMGEWNDCLHNDIMILKRDIADLIMAKGINKFILIGENVLNFHSSDDCYYEEWHEDVNTGWIVLLNFRQHVMEDFIKAGINSYFVSSENLNDFNWRELNPEILFEMINKIANRRIGNKAEY
jgi:hypothetical protein